MGKITTNRILFLIIYIIILIIPYYNIINKRLKINDNFKKDPIFQLGRFIKIQTTNQTLGNKKVVYEGYAPQTLIYNYFANHYNPNFKRYSIDYLQPMDTVLLDLTNNEELSKLYSFEILNSYYNAKEILITNKK